MGITQVPQPLQRSLDLPYSLLEHFLTEGRGANRTAEEAKAIAGDRYLGWQGGISVLRYAARYGTVRGTLQLGNTSLLLRCIYYAEGFAL